MTITVAEVMVDANVSKLKPSDFLSAGFPYCSRFGEAWHEITAMVYLEALVESGDDWRRLTPDEVKQILDGGNKSKQGSVGSVLHYTERLDRVAAFLSTESDARRLRHGGRIFRLTPEIAGHYSYQRLSAKLLARRFA